MAVTHSILRWKKYNLYTFVEAKKYRKSLVAVHVGDWRLFSYSTTVHVGRNPETPREEFHFSLLKSQLIKSVRMWNLSRSCERSTGV